MKRAVVPAAIAATLVFTPQVNAIEFDGFMTAGVAAHSEDDSVYLDTLSDDPRFDNDSKFGLQVTADIAENMQGVAQILAAGSDENFDMDVEWAYLDWRLSDNLSLRGGKVKEPVFLISDYIEVGYAYPWIRPPQEVYRNNPINTINGMEILLQTDIGAWGLTLQPYFGTNTETVPGFPDLVFDATYFYGAALQLASRNFTFQLSFLDTDVAVSGTIQDPSNPADVITSAIASQGTATLASAGFSADINNFVLYTEYVTRDIEADSALPMDSLFPDQDAWYVTVGYRMGKFLPHLTVANSEAEPLPGASQSPATPNPGASQDSITLGLRYELNDSAAFKFEVQQVEPDLDNAGSYGLFNSLDTTNFAPGDTATVISAAVDVIF